MFGFIFCKNIYVKNKNSNVMLREVKKKKEMGYILKVVVYVVWRLDIFLKGSLLCKSF